MAKDYVVEKEWVTEAGFKAVIINGRHRCGYVGIPPTHPAYNKPYDEQLDCIKQEVVDNCEIGKKSPILAFTAACRSDNEGNSIRRSIDILIDVHGGVTYSGGSDSYPIEEKDIWWFGFDCAHYDDNEIGGQSLDYCIQQCESMAKQLLELKGE